ncbi:MAG TPA: ATP-binding protein [Thermoanaerobaculia bacterium]
MDKQRPPSPFADELAQSEAELRLIVDGIRDYAIYLLAPDGRIETWSRGAQRIKGYTPEEVIGRPFDIFYPPEDVANGKPRRQLEIAAEKGTYEDESIHLRKDGSRFWAAVSISAIRKPGGELRGFVNLTHDVTEMRRQRERLAFLADASRALASIDYGETLARIARIAVPRIADWCAIDMLSEDGRTLSRVTVEHDDPAKVEQAKELQKKYPPTPSDPGIGDAIRERRAVFYPDISVEALRERGTPEQRLGLIHELGLRSLIIAPMIAGDRVLGTLTLVTVGDRRLMADDVTVADNVASRAAVAVQNAQLYREAQEANRAKDDFLATVSHELRTPMTAILGWAKLLRTTRDPSVVDEGTAAIERSASAQAQLVDDILDVGRIRVGKLRMRFEEADLGEVVERAVEMVRFTAEAKQIDLNVDLRSPEVPVQGDRQRLEQVVWNLLSNAVKFTPDGGRVAVTLESDDRIGRITVSDTGPGIDPEFLPHLFERFRQAETKQTRGHGGLGLGLSIAQYIVEAHHGSIRGESGGEGKGATFVVELPLLVKEERRRPAQILRRATDPLPSLEGVTALVAEDDEPTRKYLCYTLERAGARCLAARSVDEAIAQFQSAKVDVIVSDIAMPGKTGFELARHVRESQSRTPMLAVTASGLAADRDRALSSGFDDYLRKPVDPQTLVRTVHQLLLARR